MNSAREDAIQIARELMTCPRAERFERFFARIRDSRIPYLACQPSPDPEQLFHETFESLFLIGTASVPLAAALTMHQYVLSALATMPVLEPHLERKTQRLLREIEERRLLLAIGSVGDNIRKKGQRPDLVAVTESEDGRLRARGRTQFSCMASQADLLGFIGARESGDLGFYVVSTAGLKIGERIFPSAMTEADTRSIGLDDVLIDEEQALSTDDDLTRITMLHGTAWFEALISATYLGGATRALEEARLFAGSVDLPDGTSLAALDGARVELGRMAIQLKAALAMVPHVGRAFASLDPSELGRSVEVVIESAAVAKYTSTRTAEDVVQQARRFIGTRAMVPNGIIEELSQQVMYGPMHPKLSAVLEREIGARVAKDGVLPFNGP